MDNRKATKTIALVLISSVAVFFGFKSCYDASDGSYSTTQPSGGGTHGSYFHHGSRGSGGSSSGGHSYGTSRGGFGGGGHSVGA